MDLIKNFTLVLLGLTSSLALAANPDKFPSAAGYASFDVPAISYVRFESVNPLNPEEPLQISGQLRIPLQAADMQAEPAPVPAVVVLHSSGGIDRTGSFYIDALNRSGIATLEIDMWAARGYAGFGERPESPTLTVPDAFGALNYLAEHPQIDPANIGIIGFSWGGVVSLLAATDFYTGLYGNGRSFAAHVANYPVCWSYNIGIPGMDFSGLTGSPVMIQISDLDDYDEGTQACENLVATLPANDQPYVTLKTYHQAYHGWDRLQPTITVYDPFAHLGAGGDVTLSPSLPNAIRSRTAVKKFFEVLHD